MMLKAHQWLKQNSIFMVYFAKIYVQVGFVYYNFNDSAYPITSVRSVRA